MRKFDFSVEIERDVRSAGAKILIDLPGNYISFLQQELHRHVCSRACDIISDEIAKEYFENNKEFLMGFIDVGQLSTIVKDEMERRSKSKNGAGAFIAGLFLGSSGGE